MNQEIKNLIILYDTPSIAEWISFEWGQTLVAKYLAWKVSRKLDRYLKRKKREEFIRSFLPPNSSEE